MKITHSYQGLSLEYSRARKGTPRFAAFVVSHAGFAKSRLSQPLTIVELGVGSGQQTEFVEKQLNAAGIFQYRILVYDKSSDQLDLLSDRIKNGEISDRVIPIQHDFDGNPLPLKSDSVDLTYMAWVLHHLKNQQDVLNDIGRITRRGAGHFMYQVTIEDLENHQLDEFFPMKYEYDKQRYPTRSELRRMFHNAGFTYEKPYAIKRDDPKLIDRVFLESVENTSFDSALRMIKDNDPLAFAEGIRRVRKEVEQSERTGNHRLYVHDRRKVFWGIKE
jgi:ubiquinone/menaquinone biosynthesis C-methylase UbiE